MRNKRISANRILLMSVFGAILLSAAFQGKAKLLAAEPAPYVATQANPAILPLDTDEVGDKSYGALELTVKPTHVVKGASYLVQVYVAATGTSEAQMLEAGNLVGTFSLLMTKEGQEQQFIVAPPALAAGQKSQIAVKLIPAHPERDLGESTLEILGVRLLK